MACIFPWYRPGVVLLAELDTAAYMHRTGQGNWLKSSAFLLNSSPENTNAYIQFNCWLVINRSQRISHSQPVNNTAIRSAVRRYTVAARLCDSRRAGGLFTIPGRKRYRSSRDLALCVYMQINLVSTLSRGSISNCWFTLQNICSRVRVVKRQICVLK